MAKRKPGAAWARLWQQSWSTLARSNLRAGSRAAAKALKPASALMRRQRPPGDGDWLAGAVIGAAGMRRYWLYRPPGLQPRPGEPLPLLVMLHGCGQTAHGFATSTRMNRVAAREGFLVLYPEQDRLANAQGCWNWFDTRSGRAYHEAALILQAVDQVCRLYPADRDRVAVAGLSAGASMAALLATRHPECFKAVVMHSGIPPGTAHSGLSAVGAMQGRRPSLPSGPALGQPDWPPLLVIHGSGDAVVAPTNGQAAARVWAEAAGAAAAQPRSVQRGQRYPSLVTDFKRGGATVASLVEVGGLGHAWSGGAAGQPFGDGRGPDASRLVWAFAARQFRLLATDKVR